MVINFIKIKESDSKKTYNWRTKPRIEKFMKTRFCHSDNKQKKWITLSNKKKDFWHWIVCFKNKKIGYISVFKTQPKGKELSWGFYIGEEKYLAFSGIISIALHNYIFLKTNVKKIVTTVLSHNKKVINSRKKQGYKIIGRSDQNILIPGESKSVHRKNIEITKKIWINNNKKTINIFPSIEIYKSFNKKGLII